MKGKHTPVPRKDLESVIFETKRGDFQWRPLFGCFTTSALENDNFLHHFWVVGTNEIRLVVREDDVWERYLVEETPELRAKLLEAILLGGLES